MDEKKRAGNPAWRKGVSGNPNGRPPLEDTLRAAILKLGSKDELAQALWKAARAGNIRAMALMCDRLEGSPKESVTMTVFSHEIAEEFRREIDADDAEEHGK
jgi:hypothetical protein